MPLRLGGAPFPLDHSIGGRARGNVARLPEVTVVIPTRDRWPLLSRYGLSAALSQEGVDVEVVVVDDGSSDGTAERLVALGDPRVRVVRHESSLGQGAARNAGIAEAAGAWIAFLDDDDLWSPRKLRDQLDAAGPATFVWCSLALLDPSLRMLELVRAPGADGLAASLLRRNVLRAGSSSVVARAGALGDVGGFDPGLNELSDWDLWIRLALAGQGASVPEVLVGYLVHPGNRRAVDDSDVVAEYERLRAKHSQASVRLGVDDGPLHFSRWLAMGHRRRGERLQAAREYALSGVRYRSPGNVVRAGAALLGEKPFTARRRLAARGPAPDWLALYR